MPVKIKHPEYPWSKWFSKKRFTLVKGRDFDCQTYSMALQLRRKAAKLGVRVSLSVTEDTINVEKV